MEDVPSHPEDEDYSQGTHEPRRCVRQISLQIEIKQAQRHDGEAARSADGNPKPTRSQHEKYKSAKAEANQGRQETDPTYGRASRTRSRSSSSKALSLRGSEMV